MRRAALTLALALCAGCSALGLTDGLEQEPGCRACEELDDIVLPDECTSWQCSDPENPAEGVCVLDLIDADGDGAPLDLCAFDERPADCDDDDASNTPGAAERCDGADNDCDGTVDEGCAP